MADSGRESQVAEQRVEPDLRSVLVTSVLNLDKLDTDLYRGTHHWIPRTKRLFGGQIVGQALVAAAKSVSENVYAHSLHCYFVRAGDPKVPVLYQVERTRDGQSFCVRSVKAIQHGKAILICQASFHMQQPSPLEHQFIMPIVPPPEALLTIEELIQQYLSDPNLADNARQGLNKILADEVPIEIKPVNPPDFYRRVAMEPKKLFWVRARGHIDDTTIVGLIQDDDETPYRREDEQLAVWCSQNNLELNTFKTVEMIVDFRRNTLALTLLTILNSTVAAVESLRCLGSTISQDLKLESHIDIVKKAQQRMYCTCLRRC